MQASVGRWKIVTVMRLDRIKINNFGKFGDFFASFSDGINVIKGVNEAGKSTLVDAIINGLFTDAKSQKKSLKERFKWGSNGAKIQLNLSSFDREYVLNKDFIDGQQRGAESSSDNSWESKDAWQNFLETNLGVSDEGVFSSTACIRQDEIDSISGSSEELRDKLESIITGGHEETVASRVIDELSKRISEIKKGGSKHPGILKQLEEEAEDLKYEIDKLSRELEAAEVRRGELTKVTSELEIVQSEFEEKEELLEKYKSSLNASKEKVELEKAYDELRKRIDELSESENKVLEYRKVINENPEIDQHDVARCASLDGEVKYLETKSRDLDDDLSALKERLEGISGLGLFAVLNVINFLLMAGCGIGAYLFDIRLAAGAGGLFLTQVLLQVFLWKRYSERASLKSQIRFTEIRIEEVKKKTDSHQAEIDKIFKKYGYSSPKELQESNSKIEEFKKKIEEEATRYEELLDGKSKKSVHEDFNRITRELTVVKDRLEYIGDVIISSEKLEEMEKEVTSLSEKKIQLEEKKRLLSQQMQLTEGGWEQLSAFQERLEHNQTMHKRYENRLNVYRVTASLIEEARKDILKTTAELLERKVGEYLSTITSGRYEKIRFDRATLDFHVFSPEKQDWLASGEVFSRGTIDQIYLCARLSLVELIMGETNPFIIMDDPFVHFDPERTQNAINLLKQLSKDYQILLFTNSDQYDQHANNLIEL